MELPRVPTDLLARLRADPTRAPEVLALAAADVHGPQAARWVAAAARGGQGTGRELALRVKRRHATLARLEGAATGVGGIVTFLPDLLALVWIQSRLVFFVAGAMGLDPEDPIRPAELLVLRDLYDEPRDARDALDGTGRRLAEAFVDRSVRGREDRAVVMNLMRFGGKRMAERLGGRAVPGFAVFFNAVANERDTRRLADRAIAFYGSR
jgi:hypothetical protein